MVTSAPPAQSFSAEHLIPQARCRPAGQQPAPPPSSCAWRPVAGAARTSTGPRWPPTSPGRCWRSRVTRTAIMGQPSLAAAVWQPSRRARVTLPRGDQPAEVTRPPAGAGGRAALCPPHRPRRAPRLPGVVGRADLRICREPAARAGQTVPTARCLPPANGAGVGAPSFQRGPFPIR